MSDKYLRMADIRDRLYCSRTSVYRWMERGPEYNPFPKPRKIGGKRLWDREEVEQWEQRESGKEKVA